MTFKKCVLVAAISAALTACGSSSDPDQPGSLNSSSSSSGDEIAWDSCERFNTAQGFATLGDGTTGGADLGSGNHEVGATTGAEIVALLASDEYADQPLTIYIDDLITWENSDNSSVKITRNNVSLIGRSENAGFEGVGIELREGASNVIIRNLELRLVPQSHSPGDLISLDGRNGAISNVWIDHNEMYNSRTAPDSANCSDEDCHKDYYDELVSGRSEVHNVTISYNYMHDSWKTSLWGSSDDAAEDVGRNITFNHNLWENTNSRLPLFRYGEAHLFNNYFVDVDGSAINMRMGAEARVDGNVFENVSHPITSQFSSERGYWDVEDNIFNNVSAEGDCPTTGGECKGAHEESTTAYTPGYTYDRLPASEVKDYVTTYAGLGVLDDCLDLPPVSESR
ncbi:pectate lyase family protein [Marinimicrobium sp. ARAG 43.8]|uniref:pectate lyase family protein n=1 Tax=Marinimicrobium sp. ARAG 43.8 TaxID=3418719 RepID=UPI003CF4FDCC